ncbi:MAG: hypothetical protein A4E49_02324 [Methanosaeta sp. PtaU1.Bin112]|jgi:hypothetical protein|nr:MAG: hypothetical protein A4E49_02324 [Methanosaeta sp. PtaU1.Bin112]
MTIMAGVLRRVWSQKTEVQDRKSMELEVAKEILAEVFRIRLADVNEMIQNRFEAASSDGVNMNEDGLWPQEFWLDH